MIDARRDHLLDILRQVDPDVRVDDRSIVGFVGLSRGRRVMAYCFADTGGDATVRYLEPPPWEEDDATRR